MVELKIGHKIVFKRGSGEFVGVVVTRSGRYEFLIKFSEEVYFTHSAYQFTCYGDSRVFTPDGTSTYYFVSCSSDVRVIGEV